MEECIGIHREVGRGIEVEAALDLCNRSLASGVPQGATTQRGGGLPGGKYLGGGYVHGGRMALVSSKFKCLKLAITEEIFFPFGEVLWLQDM